MSTMYSKPTPPLKHEVGNNGFSQRQRKFSRQMPGERRDSSERKNVGFRPNLGQLKEDKDFHDDGKKGDDSIGSGKAKLISQKSFAVNLGTRMKSMAQFPGVKQTAANGHWKKVRTIGKVAAGLGKITKENEVKRKRKIKGLWDIVRNVARAAISLSIIATSHSDSDSRCGIKNYTRFRKILSQHPSTRTSFDLDFLVASVQKLPFFRGESKMTKNITDEQQLEICRTMTLEVFREPNYKVFEQGDVGRHFYIILEGSVEVSRKVELENEGNFERRDETIAHLGEGNGFGEMALIQEENLRNATVTVIEPGAFLVFNKEDFLRIFHSSHEDIFDERLKFLRTVPIFRNIPVKDLFNLGLVLQTKKMRTGSIIMQEGSPIDALNYFIIVRRGEVKIQRKLYVRSRQKKRASLSGKEICAALLGPPKLKPKQITYCILGKTEVVSDADFLCGPEDPHYVNSFTALSSTLVELYVITKHDLTSKISTEALEMIKSRLQKLPNRRYTASIYEASQSWKEYKRNLVRSVVKGTNHSKKLQAEKEEKRKFERQRAENKKQLQRAKEKSRSKSKNDSKPAEKPALQISRQRRSSLTFGMTLKDMAENDQFKSPQPDSRHYGPNNFTEAEVKDYMKQIDRYIADSNVLTRHVYKNVINDNAHSYFKAKSEYNLEFSNIISRSTFKS